METRTETCSGCGASVATSDITYTPQAKVVCPACAAKLDVVAAQAAAQPKWMGFAIAGAVAGVVPFMMHAATTSSTSVNGGVTSFVYRDWIAVICGVVAIALGVMAIRIGRSSLIRMQAIAAGLAIALLGGYQIAHGFGVFEHGSATTSATSTSTSTSVELC